MSWYEEHGKAAAALGLSFEFATDAASSMVEARATSRPVLEALPLRLGATVKMLVIKKWKGFIKVFIRMVVINF